MNKFQDEKVTAKGEQRAWVDLLELKTLWLNTGTLCNLSCENCYIESGPKNDRLVYLDVADIMPFLQEIDTYYPTVELIGLTGGEPFLNPSIVDILDACLGTSKDVLVLTNAYRVLDRHKDNLLQLKSKYGNKLHLRISLDHFTKAGHEEQRGSNTFERTLQSLKWLWQQGFNISLAGRSLLNDKDPVIGYQQLLEDSEIEIKLIQNENIVIFPEMIPDEDVPEITTACWDILNKSPKDQMCATERMIVKRKGTSSPTVLPCTLLAYDESFELGNSLKDSNKSVYLNHAFCAKFCVLGGASCSSAK